MYLVRTSLRKQSPFRASTTGFPGKKASLPRSGQCLWLVVPRGKLASANQEHCPDMASGTSWVWTDFCACLSDVISRGKPVVASQSVGCFLRLVRRLSWTDCFSYDGVYFCGWPTAGIKHTLFWGGSLQLSVYVSSSLLWIAVSSRYVALYLCACTWTYLKTLSWNHVI